MDREKIKCSAPFVVHVWVSQAKRIVVDVPADLGLNVPASAETVLFTRLPQPFNGDPTIEPKPRCLVAQHPSQIRIQYSLA